MSPLLLSLFDLLLGLLAAVLLVVVFRAGVAYGHRSCPGCARRVRYDRTRHRHPSATSPEPDRSTQQLFLVVQNPGLPCDVLHLVRPVPRGWVAPPARGRHLSFGAPVTSPTARTTRGSS